MAGRAHGDGCSGRLEHAGPLSHAGDAQHGTDQLLDIGRLPNACRPAHGLSKRIAGNGHATHQHRPIRAPTHPSLGPLDLDGDETGLQHDQVDIESDTGWPPPEHHRAETTEMAAHLEFGRLARPGPADPTLTHRPHHDGEDENGDGHRHRKPPWHRRCRRNRPDGGADLFEPPGACQAARTAPRRTVTTSHRDNLPAGTDRFGERQRTGASRPVRTRIGRSMTKVVPSPTTDSMTASPPWERMTSRTSGRPSPVPGIDAFSAVEAR
jgi:hypothetical protein